MKKYKEIIRIIKREIDLIISDIDLIAMLLAAPLFYSFFYGTMYVNKMEREIPVAVYDEDRSYESYQFVKDLNASSLIDIKFYLQQPDEIKDELISEKIEGVIFIPKNFSTDLKLNRGVTVKTFLNTQRFLHANDLNKAINEVTFARSEKLKIQLLTSNNYSIEQATESSTPLKDEIKLLFNPSESYGDFLIPAILVLVLQQTLFMGLGQSMAKENEMNKFDEVIQLSLSDPKKFIIGKALFYIALYLSYSLLFFTVHLIIFKIPFRGSYLALLVMTFLLLLSISFIAILIGSLFSKKVHALILISFTTYPLFFFTGYSWPVFSMPTVAQLIGYLIPTTPYLQSLNRILFMGAGLNHLIPELINILLLTFLYFFVAIYFLKKKFKRKAVAH